MTQPRQLQSLFVQILLAALLAFLLGLISERWFASEGEILRRWWPNIGVLILAFRLGGRSTFLPLLGGHAIGLLLLQLSLHEASIWLHLNHVLADLLEAGMMMFVLASISEDGRIRRSGDFAKAGLAVVMLPPLLSAIAVAAGYALLLDRSGAPPLLDWMSASAGAAAIVVTPWLVWRSTLGDAPLAGLAPRARALRFVGALGLAVLALVLPLVFRAFDDALVALLLLMAATQLSVRLSALLFMLMFALHDLELAPLLGIDRAATLGSAADELRACAIGITALYVRLLLAESRAAETAALAERSERVHEVRRLERLLEQVDGIVWEADASSLDFLFVSGSAERLLGYPRADWLRPGFWKQHMHAEDAAWAPTFCAAQSAAGRSHAFEYRFRHADGSYLWIRDVVSVGLDTRGQTTLTGVMIDVSALRSAVAALEDAKVSLDRLNLRHRLALTAGGIGVWEYDPKTGLHLWDDTMYRLFGEEPDTVETPADLLRARLVPESLERVASFVATLRNGGDATHAGDYSVLLPNGESHRLRTVAATTTSADGHRRLVGATWDCSVEYLAAEALRVRADQLASVLHTEAQEAVRARTAAERAEALGSDLLANVSHELRTPLHAILGFIDLASDDLTGPEGGTQASAQQAAAKLARARKAAQRLVAQVDELLDLAKLESGAVALRRQSIPLGQLLNSIQEELSAMLMAKGLRIELHGLDALAEESEGAADSPLVDVDELRTLQVLRNVLANAVRFSPDGGAIRIEVSSGPDHSLELCVRDQGPGIPEDQLATIFGKFIQGGSPGREREGGTGLGLPIAREIIRAHGGDLWAEASPEGGLFRFRIPRGHRPTV
ncbi:sensor histidine kinase [Aquimonas voraii]|uniref:histidine kinase n=1 Tax=Aquimonas voraii TaxID=265719 RepID=A0A1G6ZHN0_9GAMM|nr:PAS domain-containing sensor histidine kinase [Aquimonas voraii]SDE02224.1 PAS domain S-box-containing protein [Aquimonas voraii]